MFFWSLVFLVGGYQREGLKVLSEGLLEGISMGVAFSL